MAQPQIFLGTLDEITARYGKPLAGRRLKIVVDESEPATTAAPRPFYETATPEEWSQALREWATSHNPNSPGLSDWAVERDSIYEGVGE